MFGLPVLAQKLATKFRDAEIRGASKCSTYSGRNEGLKQTGPDQWSEGSTNLSSTTQ